MRRATPLIDKDERHRMERLGRQQILIVTETVKISILHDNWPVLFKLGSRRQVNMCQYSVILKGLEENNRNLKSSESSQESTFRHGDLSSNLDFYQTYYIDQKSLGHYFHRRNQATLANERLTSRGHENRNEKIEAEN